MKTNKLLSTPFILVIAAMSAAAILQLIFPGQTGRTLGMEYP
ncbi:hypothetical protein [Tetragenococcus koreensis]|nr:hypothetical protein [Tetragenococcus koreensis]